MEHRILETLLNDKLPIQRNRALSTIGDKWTTILSREALNTGLLKEMIAVPPLETAHDWNHYLTLQSQFILHLSEQINRLYNKNKKTVIFLAKKVYFNQIRTSLALRRQGWHTIAIFFDYQMHGHQSIFFDLAIYSDLLSFLVSLSQAKGWILHTQGWLFRYHIPVLIDAFTPYLCRHLVEFMDIQSFFLPEEKMGKIAPYMRQTWGSNCMDNHRLQLRCEKYIMDHIDRVVFTGDEGHQKILAPACTKRKFLNFGSYPLADFFSNDCPDRPNKGPWRLVAAGGIPPLTPQRPPPLFGDAQLLSMVKNLLKMQLNVDIYNNPLLGSEEGYKDLYPDYMILQKHNKKFHFHRGVMPWELADLITVYDFGLMLYDFSDVLVGNRHYQHIVPSKLFAYMEAGLPVIVSSRLTAVCNIINKFGIGFCIAEDQEETIIKLLRDCDYRKMRKNVVKARQVLSMDRQIKRLCEMYQ